MPHNPIFVSGKSSNCFGSKLVIKTALTRNDGEWVHEYGTHGSIMDVYGTKFQAYDSYRYHYKYKVCKAKKGFQHQSKA